MATYKPIQSVVLTSAASSVTFSGIDQSYTDLRLVINYGITSGNSSAILQFNNDTTSAYSNTLIWAVTSGTTGGRNSSQTGIYLLQTIGQGSGQTFLAPSTVEINNYSNTTLNKTVLSRSGAVNNSSTYEVNANVGLWRNTAAITSITIVSQSSTFVGGSTFDLYGIKAGTPKALGGDIVTTDGTYWYHTFKTSGTFTVQQDSALTVNYLVVAGGGAGGVSGGGGGGAGGLRSTVTATGGGGSLESAISLTPQSPYTIQIGAGGVGATSNSYVSSNGTNSFISGTGITTITSIGGGRGAGYTTAAVVGGSGGGGSGHNASPGNTGAAGTANQGRAGGNAGSGGAGGGGGAGVAASNAGTNSSTAGGAGVAVSITGSSVTYAGGGGGGGWYNPTTNGAAGGSGGGGAGGNGGGGTGYSGTNGTANTGGGGGGGGAGSTVDGRSGSGGSGIVVLRYPV